MSAAPPNARRGKVVVPKRLLAAFGILIATLIAVAWLALLQMERINGSLKELVSRDWYKLKQARVALSKSWVNSQGMLEMFLLENPEEIAATQAAEATNIKLISLMMDDITKQASSPEESRQLDALSDARQPYLESFFRAGTITNKAEARLQVISQTLPLMRNYYASWEEFMDFERKQLDESAKRAEEQYLATRWTTFLLSLGAVLGALGIALFVSWTVARETAERKLAEESLQRAHDELEARVVQRTRELEGAHRELMDKSRLAGMAEIATSVLHNVGNVLNSINTSCSVISEGFQQSKSAHVARVAGLLEQHGANLGEYLTNDPRGRQVPAFLKQLAESLAREREVMLAETTSLAKNVDHIKDIIAAQQSYAKGAGVTQNVKITELIEDALRMNASALTRHDVQVVRNYEALLPDLTVEKHKVLQILVNLIRNGKQACDDQKTGEKCLTIRVTSGGGKLCVAITDNGVGIPPENLTRIFNHGFTTKQHGHGFGLHSGALAAKEMGGAIHAASPGPGLGATFTLELPTQPKPGGSAPA